MNQQYEELQPIMFYILSHKYNMILIVCISYNNMSEIVCKCKYLERCLLLAQRDGEAVTSA